MRHTKKYEAAWSTARKLQLIGSGLRHENDDLYKMLEEQGYHWDSKRGKWDKFTTPPNARKTGVVDVRMRATTGDVERACKAIGLALEQAGFKIVEMSAPYPDDRHGPANTARVYFKWILPVDSENTQ